METSTAILAGVGFYVLIILVIGIHAGRRIEDSADYIVAGRNLSLGLVVFTLFATFFGGGTIMGVAGALSAHYFKFLSPSATEPLLVTFLVWVMLMAGGSGNNRGAILGGMTIWFLWSVTEIFTNRLPPEWITRSSYIRMLLVGLLLQFVLQRFRAGLLPEKSPELPFTRRLNERSGAQDDNL